MAEKKIVFVVNQQYNREAGVTVRTKRTDAAIVKEVMQIVDPSGIYTESYVAQFVKNNPALMKKYVSVYMMANRLDPASSTTTQKYCGLIQKVMRRFDRALDHFYGFRIFAPAGKISSFKDDYLMENHQSLNYSVKTMKRTVNSGSKKTTRDVLVLVTTQSPLEVILRTLFHSFETDTFKTSNDAFSAPFSFDGFDDAALYKVSADAGNGSFKMIMNLVNVRNPQGLEHVKLILEFSGVKDTHGNVVAAAFEDGSPFKFELEAICQRKVNAAKISINDEMQMVVTINTDEKHDHKSPKPLPQISGITSYQAPNMTEKNKMGVIAIDFSKVESIKACCDLDGKKLLGLSFFGPDAICIGTAYFPKQVECNARTDSVQLSQIIVAGLFVADIDFLSTFLGHQGSSSRFPCVYCLVKLSEKIRMWDPDSPKFTPRTGNRIDKGFAEYTTRYLDLPEHQQTNSKRQQVTQNLSISTIAPRIANFPDDCMGAPLVHIGLGNTLQFLTGFIFKYVDWLELKLVDSNDPSYRFCAQIQEQRDNLVVYIEWLQEELADTAAVIQGRDAYIKSLTERMTGAKEVLENPRFSEATYGIWIAKLVDLEEEQRLFEEANTESADESEHNVHLMETLAIALKTKDEVDTLFKKHKGNFKRIIIPVLKKFGVDIQIYFNGVMNGEHCMKFASNGDGIMSEITERIMPYLKDKPLQQSLTQFSADMKKVLALWYNAMRFMERTGRRTQDEIDMFRTERQELKVAIKKLDKDFIPISLPTTSKWHIYFTPNCGLDRLVDNWGITGSVAEQNTETVHAHMNQLARRFGNTRGHNSKKNILKAWTVEGSPFVSEGINKLLNATKLSEETKKKACSRLQE